MKNPKLESIKAWKTTDGQRWHDETKASLFQNRLDFLTIAAQTMSELPIFEGAARESMSAVFDWLKAHKQEILPLLVG